MSWSFSPCSVSARLVSAMDGGELIRTEVIVPSSGQARCNFAISSRALGERRRL